MIIVLVGTRPELIKMAPVVRQLQKKKVKHLLVHSNQHYSPLLDTAISQDLDLPEPTIHLNVGSGAHGAQTGEMMRKFEEVCMQYNTRIVLVQGDTNTALAGALVAKKLHIAVGHVEAGLRSFDETMPEEVNRIIIDRISDRLYAPTRLAADNLRHDGIPDSKIVITGNTVVDALVEARKLLKNFNSPQVTELEPESFILLTAHRPANVDTVSQLKKLLKVVRLAYQQLQLPVIWPVHPRTLPHLEKLRPWPSWLRVWEPVSYLAMLSLTQKAALILTDSGGVQEEAFVLRKIAVTLRTTTERPETLSANAIVGLDPKLLKQALTRFYVKKDISWNGVLGDGKASQRIVQDVVKYLKK